MRLTFSHSCSLLVTLFRFNAGPAMNRYPEEIRDAAIALYFFAAAASSSLALARFSRLPRLRASARASRSLRKAFSV